MNLQKRMDGWLQRAGGRRSGMPPPQVLAVSERSGIEYNFGDRDRKFHGASIGKVMTATLVLGLVEEGRFGLDDPIAGLLPESDYRGLVVVDGVDLTSEVTVRQLLSHTSGAPDYFEDPTSAPMSFVDEIVADPDRLWTPSDLLDYSRTFLRASGRPGERFHYSDTGYILLGRIIEESTGESFGHRLDERIFGPTGMGGSSLLFHGSAAAVPDIAPLWLGKHELSQARSLSADWSGGGIVTTLDDLVRFQTALHGGALISAGTVEMMGRALNRFRPGIQYGTGMMRLQYPGFFPLLRGLGEPVGHIGVLATHMFYHPEYDLHLVLNFHSTEEMTRSFRAHIRIVQAVARGS